MPRNRFASSVSAVVQAHRGHCRSLRSTVACPDGEEHTPNVRHSHPNPSSNNRPRPRGPCPAESATVSSQANKACPRPARTCEPIRFRCCFARAGLPRILCRLGPASPLRVALEFAIACRAANCPRSSVTRSRESFSRFASTGSRGRSRNAVTSSSRPRTDSASRQRQASVDFPRRA